MSELENLWTEIIAWFRAQGAPDYQDLTPGKYGASAEEITQLERKMEREVPEDFKEHLRFFNKYYCVDFLEYSNFDIQHMLEHRDCFNMLKADGAFEESERHMEPSHRRVRHTWWHEFWLPFAEDGGGNLICLDLDPSDEGTFGQIFFWERDAGPCIPEACSFTEFVRQCRDEILSGKYEYDDYYGFQSVS